MPRDAVCILVAILAIHLSTSAAIASGCTITGNAPTVTASDIDFMNYRATDTAPATANGSVRIRCPLGVGLLPSFEIALSAGNGTSFQPRAMTMGSNRLTYNIYTGPDYSTVWGNGNDGSVTQSFSAILSLGTITFMAYGSVPTSQYVSTGTYSDTITVTVTY